MELRKSQLDGITIIGESGESIGRVYQSPEAEKYARMFSAAPELLDALVYARRMLVRDKSDFDAAHIDEVIAKATGREV